MPALHQEIHFESAICTHLGQHGWLYAEGDAAQYDRQNALFLPDLLAWVESTQPEAWQALTKTHGASLPKVLAERVRKWSARRQFPVTCRIMQIHDVCL